MRLLWSVLLIPLVGCAHDIPYEASPPMCAPPPPANACFAPNQPYRPAFASPVPQTPEPPR